MAILSKQGEAKLIQFVNEHGSVEAVETYARLGNYSDWADMIDYNGRLVMPARHSRDGTARMTRFEGDDFPRRPTAAEIAKSYNDYNAGADDALAGRPNAQPGNQDYVDGFFGVQGLPAPTATVE